MMRRTEIRTVNRATTTRIRLAAAGALAATLGAASISWSVAHAGQDEGTALSNPFAAPALPVPGEVMMLKLRDGTIQWGAIEEHSSEAIEFKRLDTLGVAHVAWSLVDPLQSETLRTEFGYVSTEVQEALVEGDRLLLDGGGTVEGIIVSREGDSFLVKTDGTLLTLPKVRVRSIETKIQIPALDVYSREEIYGLYLAETDVTSAEAVLGLARKCEGILDFEHAIEHYGTALELGLTEDVPKVEGALAAASVKAENQEQIEILRAADQLRKRGKFDEALGILRAFPEQFKKSPLIEDARAAEQKMLLARDAAATQLTRSRWNYWAGTLTRAKAREATFEEARTWAMEQAGEEIQAKVHEDLVSRISEEIRLEDVRTYWEARSRRGGYRAATYGSTGTWLLGREKAQAGAPEGSGETAGPVSAVDAERKAINERIKRYVANQRIAQRAQGSVNAEDERQEFWSSWKGRAKWLFTYYAEESGDFEVRPKPALRNCPNCAGDGAIQLIATGSVLKGESQSLATCNLCHGVQVVRRIYYR